MEIFATSLGQGADEETSHVFVSLLRLEVNACSIFPHPTSTFKANSSSSAEPAVHHGIELLVDLGLCLDIQRRAGWAFNRPGRLVTFGRAPNHGDLPCTSWWGYRAQFYTTSERLTSLQNRYCALP